VGVLTSTSLAIKRHSDKVGTTLKLIFTDEIENDENVSEDTADKNADYCLFKIKSLSNHKHILPMPPKSTDGQKLPENAKLNKISDDGVNYLIDN